MSDFSTKIRAICNRIFNLLPLQKKKIFFDNYFGRSYGCNPKYICEVLHREHPDYDLVWHVRKECMADFPSYVRTVKFNSLRAIWEQATASIWVRNVRLPLWAKKRSRQFYIQTWHGAIGVKKCEGDAADKITPQSVVIAHHDSPQIDVMISNSRFCTEVYKRAFWYQGTIAEIGYPRNDLMAKPSPAIIQKVREFYRIAPTKKIFFYAPTFRKDSGLWDSSSLDIERTLDNLGKKFGGEWICLLRLHPWAAKACEGKMQFGEKIVNATHYPDIQELLAAADIMITDYSSCQFDFLIQRKPTFMFAPDIDSYLQERGLLFKPEELPFPCALNNDELEKIILDYDEDAYRGKANAFFETHQLQDDGEASKRVADIIDMKIQSGANS